MATSPFSKRYLSKSGNALLLTILMMFFIGNLFAQSNNSLIYWIEKSKHSIQNGDTTAALESAKKAYDIVYSHRDNDINTTRLQLAEEQTKRLDQNRKYLWGIIISGTLVFLLLLRGFILNRKLNVKLRKQNNELEAQTKELESAMFQLKATQDQLIESERLASLGQLTAGIAHEIRNPLNFVNNFSSLIDELLEEIAEIISKMEIPLGDLRTDLLDLLHLIKDNNEKVNRHGIRASQIISRMLDTSHGGVSTFEETDINQLIMDSAKLAYQGVKGELTGFNLDLEFQLDSSIGNVKVIHQDLGRVLINIVNNSCQALEEKIAANPDFEAKIMVKSHNLERSFQCIVEDNGKGMSEELQHKIFNPFFTTKPTGKGTGLGLTMTYDIVTKMHQGSIHVESEEGKYSRFIIEIPKNLNPN